MYMKLPEFTAELALGRSTRVYRGRTSYGSPAHNGDGMSVDVNPSQFDAAEELGGMDEPDVADEAGTDEAGFDGVDDVGADDGEGVEDADFAGDDEAEGEDAE